MLGMHLCLIDLTSTLLYRVTRMIPMKTRGQRRIKEDLKALLTRIVTVTGLVLVEEVRDMIKKIGNMVVITR